MARAVTMAGGDRTIQVDMLSDKIRQVFVAHRVLLLRWLARS
ncbi:MAG: hypothetical protein RBS57_10895 [Desulforhabdus sp.]|nr:hypothetical protein [Desulforhabdus sp.]